MKILCFSSSALFFTVISVSAQTVPYLFSQTAQPYQMLADPTPLTFEWMPWKAGDQVKVPIGFVFRFCEADFDSVTVDLSSRLCFGEPQMPGNLCFAGFSEAITDLFYVMPGATESLSPVAFELTGTPGNRIFKIQWENAGFSTGLPEDFIHFQIWLCENNHRIEIHFGPRHISSSEVYEGGDGTGPVIGFINEPEGEFLYLFGDAQNPVYGYPPFGFKGLEGTPDPGTVFRFTPFTNMAVAPANQSPGLIHYPADHQILLTNATHAEQLTITDCTGKILEVFPLPHRDTVALIHKPYPAGLYVITIQSNPHYFITKKIMLF